MLALQYTLCFATRELLHRCVNQMPAWTRFSAGKISSLCVPGRKLKNGLRSVATWCRDTASAVHADAQFSVALDNPFIGCYQPDTTRTSVDLPAPFGPSKVKIFQV